MRRGGVARDDGDDELMRGVAHTDALGAQECLSHLATVTTGRVAGSMGALPVVFPVRFVLVGGSLVFSLPPGSPMWAAAHDHVIAFEADGGIDSEDQGWAVQVQGVCSELTSATSMHRYEDLPLPKWHTGGNADHLMLLHLERISGERITWGLAEPKLDGPAGTEGSR